MKKKIAIDENVLTFGKRQKYLKFKIKITNSICSVWFDLIWFGLCVMLVTKIPKI